MLLYELKQNIQSCVQWKPKTRRKTLNSKAINFKSSIAYWKMPCEVLKTVQKLLPSLSRAAEPYSPFTN